jgi:hypothetical protein
MAIPANSSKMSENLRHVNQGARPTEITENQRIALRDDSPAGDSTGESHATENSENKRIETVVYPS